MLCLIVGGCSKPDNPGNGNKEPENLEPGITLDEGSSAEVGYWSEEHTLHIEANGEWTLEINDADWIEFKDSSERILSGSGKDRVGILTKASGIFSDRSATVTLNAEGFRKDLTITQKASPDLLTLLEDELFRMATASSFYIYGIDADENGKISALEAEFVPEEGIPYGIDAGGWGVSSVKGIENFPHLRHLDVTGSPNIVEMDLSGNPDLHTLLTFNCPALSDIKIENCRKLIEIGFDYGLFLKVRPFIESLNEQFHTIGLYNRKEYEPSDIDFSIYRNINCLYISNNGFTSICIDGCSRLWKLIAMGNNIKEIDLSGVDREHDNYYMMQDCPELERIYVWKGWTEDYYDMFYYDDDRNIEIIEK